MSSSEQVWCVQIFRVADPEVADAMVMRLGELLGDDVTAMSTGGRRDSSVAVETLADADFVTTVQAICAEVDPMSELIHLSTADPWHADGETRSAAA